MHSPTLLTLLAVLLGILAMSQCVSWFFGRRVLAQLFWAGAYLSAFLSSLNFLTRPYQPELFTFLATQVTQFFTPYLILLGARCYMGLKPWPWRYAASAVLALLIFALFSTLIDQSPALRIVASTLVTGTLFALSAITIAKGGMRQYPARYIFALLCSFHAAFVFARIGFIYKADSKLMDFVQGTAIPPFLILEAIVFLVMMSFVMLMLINEATTSELRKLAEIDPLTNTFNRRSFLKLLDKVVSAVNRGQSTLSVLLIDLDHFKQINDTYGHRIGDEMLCHFVGITSACLRNEDVLGRVGGEEFAVFLPTANITEAHQIAERVRANVAQHPLATSHGQIPLTISIGVAQYLPDEAVESTLHRADEAMYRAKEGGRNRVELCQLSAGALQVNCAN